MKLKTLVILSVGSSGTTTNFPYKFNYKTQVAVAATMVVVVVVVVMAGRREMEVQSRITSKNVLMRAE